jgi:hypothetical protein
MSLHLFSKPVQCTQCGTTVDDPTVERCPKCAALLKERRAPRRLAGVEQRYGSFRILLNVMRFLGVIILMLGALVFFAGLGSGRGNTSENMVLFVGSIVLTVVLFAAAGLFELLMDMEENTRSSFRLQQMMLEELAEARGAHAMEVAPSPAVPVSPEVAAAAVPAEAQPRVVPA